MKVKNLKVGLRVQVKHKNHVGFYSDYAGEFGVITKIDADSLLDVRVEFDDGDYDWGNHKGIKRAPVEVTEDEVQAPQTIGVGSRVRLKSDKVLGFLAGDVGTVKDFDSDGDAVVHFDVARNGWESAHYGIPELHGLYVLPEHLEVISD